MYIYLGLGGGTRMCLLCEMSLKIVVICDLCSLLFVCYTSMKESILEIEGKKKRI